MNPETPQNPFAPLLPGMWEPPSLDVMEEFLPKYQFLRVIGRGGMGVVYQAVQSALDRAVAVKVLPADLVDDSDVNFVERFRNEARTMARMDHPGIVRVYEFGETTCGLLYFVMEFIDGTDVASMVRSQQKLPEEHALSIAAHICDALQYAHDRGVIHRDIKPGNVLINRAGHVKVMDFGLAKMTDSAGNSMGLTQTNLIMGTPDYMAPEALIDATMVDHRSDLYAVGVMLYRLLTGEVPRGVFTRASELVSCDPRFDSIITRAMESSREKRYQQASDIRRDLDTIFTTPPEQTEAGTPIEPPQPEPIVPVKAGKTFARVAWSAIACAVMAALAWIAFSAGGKRWANTSTSVSAPQPVVAQRSDSAQENASGSTQPSAAALAPAKSNSAAPPAQGPASLNSPPAQSPQSAIKPPVASVASSPATPTSSASSHAKPQQSSGPLAVAPPIASPKSTSESSASGSSPAKYPHPATPPAAIPPIAPATERSVMARLAEFESVFRKAEIDARKGFDASLADLNGKYLVALKRERDQAAARAAWREVTSLEAEDRQIRAGQGVPATNAKDTPRSLERLRQAYRTEAAKPKQTREDRVAQAAQAYLAVLSDYRGHLLNDKKTRDANLVSDVLTALAKALEKSEDIPTVAVVLASVSSAMDVELGPPPVYVPTPLPGQPAMPPTHRLAYWVLTNAGRFILQEKGGRFPYEGNKELPSGTLTFVEIKVSLQSANDMDLELFSAAKDLEVFELDGAKVPQPAFFKRFPKLRDVIIRSKPDATSMPVLAGQSGLRGLQIHWKITDDELAALSGLGSLEHLTLTDPPTGVGFAGMKGSRRLNLLRLGTRSNKINDQGVAAIAGAFPALQVLDLGTSEFPARITSAAMPALASLRMLRDLGLDGPNINDASLTALSQLSTLQSLKLRGTRVTGSGFASFPPRNALVSINLENSNLNDDGLMTLVKMRSLNSVAITGANVSDAAVKKFEAACPGVKVLR